MNKFLALTEEKRLTILNAAFQCFGKFGYEKASMSILLYYAYALHKTGADRMCKKRIQMDADAASTTEALKHCQIPVLFVHGTDDHFVPVEMTYENYKACTSEKRLLIVPGADHCMSYLVGKSTYERIAKEFWEFCEQRKKNP